MASSPTSKSPTARGIQAGRENLPTREAQVDRKIYGFPTTSLDKQYSSPVSYPKSTPVSRPAPRAKAPGFVEDARSATPAGRVQSALLHAGSRPGLMRDEAGMSSANYSRASESSPRELRVAEQAAADSLHEKRDLNRAFAPIFGMPGYYTGSSAPTVARALGALAGKPKAAQPAQRTSAREDNPQFPAIVARKKIDEAAKAGNLPAAVRIYAQAEADKERAEGRGVGKPILSLVRAFGFPHVKDVDAADLAAPKDDSDRQLRNQYFSRLRRSPGIAGLLSSSALAPPSGTSDATASAW